MTDKWLCGWEEVSSWAPQCTTHSKCNLLLHPSPGFPAKRQRWIIRPRPAKLTTTADGPQGGRILNEGWTQRRTGRAEEGTLMTGCSVSSHSQDKWSCLHRLMSPMPAKALWHKCGEAAVTEMKPWTIRIFRYGNTVFIILIEVREVMHSMVKTGGLICVADPRFARSLFIFVSGPNSQSRCPERQEAAELMWLHLSLFHLEKILAPMQFSANCASCKDLQSTVLCGTMRASLVSVSTHVFFTTTSKEKMKTHSLSQRASLAC